MMESYLKNEINLRENGPYSYNIQDIDFLNLINKELTGLENSLLIDTDEYHPNIWILGLPRAGTTLLTQLIFNCLDIACTNNLMARFWETPIIGSFLSKIVLQDNKSDSFKSDYGKTSDIYSPHEFSWFWHDLLKIDNIPAYDPISIDKEINWNKLKLKILNMNRILDKGIVFKPLEFVGYHSKRFNDIFQKSLFVYIERDSLDIALSLAKTRLDYYNNIETWWGSYPLEYQAIKNKPFWEQIPAQIFYLRQMYYNSFQKIDSARLLSFNYKALCYQPQDILNKIINKSKKILGHRLKQIYIPPERFEFSTRKKKVEDNIKAKLVNGIQMYNLLK